MKPNFDEMSKAELKAYILSHRDDDEAIRVLFGRRHPPDSEATWYGPMYTPKGVPIEENMRIAEEAIRKRAKENWKNDQFTSQTMTIVTQEEIKQFREQLVGYPEAIAALNVIQECDGYLEDAVTLLIMRETGQEPDRGLNEWVQKSRKIICREELAVGLIAAALEPLATSAAIPPGIATAVGIYVYKIGVRKFCEPSDSEP